MTFLAEILLNSRNTVGTDLKIMINYNPQSNEIRVAGKCGPLPALYE